MKTHTCDVCGCVIEGPEDHAKIGVGIPIPVQQQAPGAELADMFRPRRTMDLDEFDACVECATAQLLALKQRVLMLRTTGRVEQV